MLAAGLALLAGTAGAQPGPGEVLRGLEVRRAGEDLQVLVRFRGPIRLLARGVRGPATTLPIPVQELVPRLPGPPDRNPAGRREALRPPADRPGDLLLVSYEPRPAGPALLELRFRVPVYAEVSPGRDGRSVAVTFRRHVGGSRPEDATPAGGGGDTHPASQGAPAPPPGPRPPPRAPDPGGDAPGLQPTPGPRQPRGGEAGKTGAPPGWAVQILAVGPEQEPPDLAAIRKALPPHLRGRLYLVRAVGGEGRRLLRVRLGPFPNPAEAGRARHAVVPSFPDAWIAPETARVPVPRAADAAPDALARADASASTGRTPDVIARPAAPAWLDPASEGSMPPAEVPAGGGGRAGGATPAAAGGGAKAPLRATELPAGAAAAGADAPTSRAPELVQRARTALREGRPGEAIPLLEGALESGDPATRRAARELLGVARERAGQLAHARAEYERYLAEWPEGEASDRVRQRLEALLARAAVRPAPLRLPREDTGTGGFRTSGSLYTGYRRETRRTRLAGEQVLDSSLYGDLYLRSHGRAGPLELATEVSGSYLLDLGNRSDDVGRVRLLGVGLALPEQGLALSFGRQTGNRFGVTGRFDGLELHGRLGERVELRAFGGFPTEPLVSNRVRTGRVFAGAGVGLRELRPGLDLDLHATQQWSHGRTDRQAVGGELRFSGERLFAWAFADWDLLFDRLNVLAFHASFRAGDRTDLYLAADERHLPELTLENALLGTTFDDLDELRRARPEADLESLARARTARSRIVRLGGSRGLGDRLHLTAELELSDLAGIASDGDVQGFDGTGLELGFFGQLVASDLLGWGEVATFTASARDGDLSDLLLLLADVRFRLGRRVRLVPLLLLSAERARGRDDRLTVEPGLRIDLGWGAFTGEIEGRYRSVRGELFPGSGDENDLVVEVGLRYDF